ncbi:ABC exporter membrane fusion family protein, putative [Babesia ovis]|uniref:ABC exporter membrane fusion family protein, putative n=1 Tax=Babesia ovis TaxID=5869 RepID=A0A9W5T7K4_BABOV|nr:ABC exporter membrane fusion family protein, putative [Babesia ovis]
MSVSKSQVSENMSEDLADPGGRERCPSFTYGNTRRGRLNCHTLSIEKYITDRDLFLVSAKRRSKWNRYHLGNVYIDSMPIIRLWLQNEREESLLSDDRITLLEISETVGKEYAITIRCSVRLPELQLVEHLAVTICASSMIPRLSYDTSTYCQRTMALPNGSYQVEYCTSGAYEYIVADRVIKTMHGTFYVFKHIVLTLNDGKRTSVLYSFLYNAERGNIIAIRRSIILSDGKYIFTNDIMAFYDRPITASEAANVFVTTYDGPQTIRLYPHHSGSVVKRDEGIYEVNVLPFGTLEKSFNVLNEVQYSHNGVTRTLVVPLLRSITGLNLIAEDKASYVLAHGVSSENLEVVVVYNVRVPGMLNAEEVRLMFNVMNGQISMIGPMNAIAGNSDISKRCVGLVPLGNKALCTVHQIMVDDQPGYDATLYTFLYDTESRQLTAVMHIYEASASQQEILQKTPTDAFVGSAKYMNDIKIVIDEKGEINISKAYIGYTSESSKTRTRRAIIVPEGNKKQHLKYTDRVSFQGVTLLALYLESEDGRCLLDKSLSPRIEMYPKGDEYIVRITCDLMLPNTETTQPITLEFACISQNTKGKNKGPNITLVSKYQRFSKDGNQCVIDASVWTGDNESFGGKCTVGAGEKGTYVIMSRIIQDNNQGETGTIYKFLYDSENSTLFARAAPVMLTEGNKGKVCRWVRVGKDTNYEFSIGGVTPVAHEVWSTTD